MVNIIMIWLSVGSVCTIMFFFQAIIFGRLNLLQLKIWLLKNRGFHLIEHIQDTVRRYYFMRPKENKFEFKTGYYLNLTGARTKTDKLMPKTPAGFSFFRLNKIDDTSEENKLSDSVKKFIYDKDAATTKFGIPTMTYVGANPNPINFSAAEQDAEFSAGVIRDSFMRLLATQQYGDWIKFRNIALIVGAVVAISLILVFIGLKNNAAVGGNCIQMWNATQSSLIQCINKTAIIGAQGSTVIV